MEGKFCSTAKLTREPSGGKEGANSMRVDYHMHLETGPLTLEYLERFWRQAQKAGLDEIGISGHGHSYK